MFSRILIILVLNFILSLTSFARASVLYQLDRSVFTKYPEIAADYTRLQNAFERGETTRADHRTRLAALQKLIVKEPEWVDGLWLFSAESFVLAASYDAPRQYPDALAILREGIQSGEHCLEKNEAQVLCKFFLASLMAKKASIEGIISSLRLGFRIHALWMDVMASPYEFWFRPNSSLQGSVRYGLGLFYRLVPNRWIMQTMFHIRGNLNRSVELHREGLAINPDDPCSRLMLGTALLCRCQSEQTQGDCREGLTFLQSVAEAQAFDANQRLCKRDSEVLRKDQQLACGYTQALPVKELAVVTDPG